MHVNLGIADALLPFIKLPFVINICGLSIFEALVCTLVLLYIFSLYVFMQQF